MTKRFLLIALTGILSFSPLSPISYVHAEDAYSNTESNMEQEVDQSQEQWISDEPSDIENDEASEPEGGESYDPEEERG